MDKQFTKDSRVNEFLNQLVIGQYNHYGPYTYEEDRITNLMFDDTGSWLIPDIKSMRRRIIYLEDMFSKLTDYLGVEYKEEKTEAKFIKKVTKK